MARYQYEPLELERSSFRLVRLIAGEAYHYLRCEIFDAWFDDPEGTIEYEALSYTWGSKQKPFSLLIEETTLSVTENLHAALKALRYKHQDRILWIDAICIDQENVKERGHQVRQMASIYHVAREVIVWLGQGSSATDLVLHDLRSLEKASIHYACSRWLPSDERWNSIWDAAQLQQPNDTSWLSSPSHRDGLDRIFEQDWFRRVWIIQEICNAKVARITCGSKSVSGRFLALIPFLFGFMVPPHIQAILDIMPGPSRDHSWWSQDRSLLTLLFNFRESQATEGRDKIYALLAISSDAHNVDELSPDYGITDEEVVNRTTTFLLGSASKGDLGWSSPHLWSLMTLELMDDPFLESPQNVGDIGTIKRMLELTIQQPNVAASTRSPLCLSPYTLGG